MWNYADIFESIANAIPNKSAQIQGDRVFNWRQFDHRANALAAHFLEAGLTQQSKVAAYLHNCPEYLETYYACFKVSMVPVNTNYRYSGSELHYLWDNADAEAIIFHATYAPVVETIKSKLPKVRQWYAVEDGTPLPGWAIPYESLVGDGAEQTSAPWARSGDDLMLLYTGGTTGMPKGVMWRQDDLFNLLGAAGNELLGIPSVTTPAEIGARCASLPEPLISPYVPACPLMHGTGQFGALIAMALGRAVVCLENRKFDADELWRLVERHKAGLVSIVGDAFARPMLDALEASSEAYDLSSLVSIVSSGVMWSQENKAGLIRHIPQVTLADSLGSSEAIGLGSSLTTAEQTVNTADFERPENLKVFTEDGQEVQPGDDQIGLIALSGFLPAGYYKDEEKTAKTFRTVDGVRYSMPGDFAKINADGSFRLLGRGSVCINTGGEKVFPEEVEEVLKLNEQVADAVCVGVPNDRFGQAICAVVEPINPDNPPKSEDLSTTVRAHLAAYKAPRHTIIVKSINRAPNGKVDYKQHEQAARERLGLS